MRCIRAVKALRAREGEPIERRRALHRRRSRRAVRAPRRRGARAAAAPRGEVSRLPRPRPACSRRCAPPGADAVWPGWGFVAEDPGFVERCAAAGIRFLGPLADGDARARRQDRRQAARRERRRAGAALERRRGRERGRGAEARPSGSAIRWWSRRRPAAAVAASAIVEAPRRTCRGVPLGARRGARGLRRRPPVPRAQGAAAAATSRCRSSPTSTARCSRSAAATARCSAATRR